jgi:hypothetical protein
MERILIACAVAALLAFPASASAQSYNDLRARAMCLEVGATADELPGCIQSVKTKMFLQNLGRALKSAGGQGHRRSPDYAGPNHPWIAPPPWERQYQEPRRDCWIGDAC